MNSKEKALNKSAAAKKIKIRKIVFIAAVITALIAVCLFTPVFGISSITVEGNRVLDSESVIRASGINIGENVFRLNTKKAEKKISSLGHIEKVKIKRKFPSKILIEVEECAETVYILFAGNYIGVDSDLKVLSISKSNEIKADKTIISGMALKNFKKGETIEAAKEKKQQAIKTLISNLLDESLLSNVKKIDITKINDINITLDTDTVVCLGNSERLGYKISYLKEVLLNLDNLRGGEIDLSDTENVIYKGGE